MWPVHRRVSRRILFLGALGCGWIGYGLGIVTDPRYGTSRGLAPINRHVPMECLGWMWVVTGGISLLSALVFRRAQPAGFAALATPAALWGVAFTVTWAKGGFPSASGSACAWLAFAVAIYAVSGLTDPPPRVRPPEGVRR
ncbi:hypothetical protein ACIQU5_32075 [Streptomyces sp. NPDC090306]|uniref:hypothetical protein n=1 Tax=Streptomyces sp. NPDC090306 TaxID=3365961 RepID=UPI00381E58DD